MGLGVGSDGARCWCEGCSSVKTTLVTWVADVAFSALRWCRGGFHHGVDAGKSTNDSERNLTIYPKSLLVVLSSLCVTPFKCNIDFILVVTWRKKWCNFLFF